MRIRVLKPAEAPSGIRRLLPFLAESLAETEYNACRIIVAFARLSGVARLLPQIRAWRSRGSSIEAIVGIDRFSTSREALQVMLDELDQVYITHTTDESCTFHPKVYLFEGEFSARAVVGSHNLTLGGLETNFESGVIVDLTLPEEVEEWQQFRETWDQLLPAETPITRRLDTALLRELIRTGWVLSEIRGAAARRAMAIEGLAPVTKALASFPAIAPAPPSPLPKSLIPGARSSRLARPRVVEQPSAITGLPRALVIEIIPHHNGEIFLSKTAANSLPAFFGMPFTGRTVPKKAGNPAYPMRVPDPIVDWRLYGLNGEVLHHSRFGLYMVFYEGRSEVRITVTPSLARTMPEYSLMVMWGGPSPRPASVDYVIEVFVPGSPGHRKWEPAMNLTLPGGGRARPRRMGWI